MGKTEWLVSTVWCLTRFANQSYRMMGVFTSEAKARAYVKKTALEQHKEALDEGLLSASERRMKEETIIDRFWSDMQLDLEEMEIQ